MYIVSCIVFLLFFCRRGTKLVLAASMTFLILMFPRGISFVVKIIISKQSLSIDIWRDEAHQIVDMVTWWLQYLNHSVNFFVYVVANNKFRLCT